MKLRAATPASAVPCKICGAMSDLFGVVDFHKSCIEANNLKLPLSGIPVSYRRCGACRFVFTDAFDDWSKDEFQRYIYNRDYVLVDPEYVDIRPAATAKLVDQLFSRDKNVIRLIDYGGGNGKLAQLLRQTGFAAETFDPFSAHNVRPAAKANIVTCFEVMEHTNKPQETLDDLISFLDEESVLLFSTELQSDNFDNLGVSWWYVAPRNGHVSIYSREALAHLFKSRGFTVTSVNNSLHLACRNIPAFAADIFKAGQIASTAA